MLECMAKKHTAKQAAKKRNARDALEGETQGPGKLARVKILPPAVRPKDVDLRPVRKAVREYFRKHPRVLERT
jgi:hypothetical protein